MNQPLTILAYAHKSSAQDQAEARELPKFTVLCAVEIKHNYYQNGLCPDFKFVPDQKSTELMLRFNMNVRYQSTGFSIYIKTNKIAALKDYIKTTQAQKENSWCWISFLMIQINPLFISLTNLPINITAGTHVMWFCNIQAQAQNETIYLTAGGTVEASALYPLTSRILFVDVHFNAKPVLKDISGQIVLSTTPAEEERNFPTGPVDDYVPMVTGNVQPTTGKQDRYRFDLRTLSYGIYTIELTEKSLSDITASQPPVPSISSPTTEFPRTYAYVPDTRRVFGIINLLLSEPNSIETGIYPVLEERSVQPVFYTLAFDARQTIWHYYVSCQQETDKLSATTKIELIQGGPVDGLTFTRSDTKLPSGAEAALFTATAPLPLRQCSPFILRLSGERQSQNGKYNLLNISKLPVAPATPVWPATSIAPDMLSGISEIYLCV